MQDEDRASFASFDERLKRLRGAAKPHAEGDEAKEDRARAGLGDGLQVGIELVAGVAGGSLLGWMLDVWLGTQPWLLIVFFFLGAAAGMRNAYRHLQSMGLVDGAAGSGEGAERNDGSMDESRRKSPPTLGDG